MRPRLRTPFAVLLATSALLAEVASGPAASAQRFEPDDPLGRGAGSSTIASSAVRMDVRAGFDGQGRVGGWIPLEVELVNQGPEVRAEIQVQVGLQQGRGTPVQVPTTFSLPVVLPRLSQKRFSVDVNLPSVQTRATARLVSSTTKETLAEQEVQMGRVPLGDYFCGVLARDPAAYDFLAAIELPPPIRRVRTAPLEPATIPERAQLLGSFDCIIVDNAATGQLRQQQLDALQVWVGTGGLLVLVGGPTWQSTLGPLPPALLPVTPTGLTQVKSLEGIAQVTDVPIDSAIGPWLVTQSRPRVEVGASVVASQDGVPLIVAAKRGEGTTMYLGFEPTARALRGWGGAEQLWRYVISHAAVDNGVGSALVRPYLRWGRVPRVGLADFTTQPRSGLDWMWKLVGVYGLTLSVGLFLLGRRGFTGGSVLATLGLVSVASAGAFSLARQNADPDAAVTRLSVVRPIEVGDSAAAYTREYVSILAKREGQFSFTLPGDALARGLFFPAPRPPDESDTSWPFRVKEGVNPVLNGLPLRQGQLATTVIDGQLRQAPGVQADLRVENGTLTGTLTNRTAGRLTDAYVVIDGNTFRPLGTLDRDEVRQVDVVLPRQAAAGSMAASALAQQLLPQEGQGQGQGQGQNRPGSAAKRDLVESLFFDRFLFRRMEMRGPTLVAWLEQAPTTFQGNEIRTSNADFALLVQPLQPRLPRGFEGEVPAAAMNRRDLGIGSGTPTDQPFYTVAQGEAITLQFAVPPAEGRYQQRQLRLNVEGVFNGRPRAAQPPITVSLFNWRASEWQGWDVVIGSSIIPDGDRYLSAVGEIRVRYNLDASPSNPVREARFTRLDVSSVGVVR